MKLKISAQNEKWHKGLIGVVVGDVEGISCVLCPFIVCLCGVCDVGRWRLVKISSVSRQYVAKIG